MRHPCWLLPTPRSIRLVWSFRSRKQRVFFPRISLPEVPIYPVVEVEGQSITVSSLAVSFGAHLKGQLAAVVLFNIMNGNGNAIREGWIQVRHIVCLRFSVLHVIQVFEILLNLFIHSLLPTRMLQMEWTFSVAFP